MSQRRAIVIVTPVKNEDWILERFLSVASRCADAVIIADQGSTDRSRAIYRQFEKVTVFENPSPDYNEVQRQSFLIDKAREIVPGEKVLLALDADEIIAADAPNSSAWQAMLHAPAGTVLSFEKPDLLAPPDQCIRYAIPFPIGFVDDGTTHHGRLIHSTRVPTPEGTPRQYVEGVKVLHYALTRPEGQNAKYRRYSVLENIMATSPLWRRRLGYAVNRDYVTGKRVGPSPQSWFTGWEEAGIDMLTIGTDRHHWQDFDILEKFARHGVERFWFDDIWDLDWEAKRQYARSIGLTNFPDRGIEPPPAWRQTFAAAVTRAYAIYLRLHGGRW